MRKEVEVVVDSSYATEYYVKSALINEWNKNGFDTVVRFKFTNPVMGADIIVTPCTGYCDATSVDDIEYFLIDTDIHTCGDSSLSEICHMISNMNELRKRNAEDRERLEKFRKEHENDNDREWYDYYSDWYKDVYGYRPRS